MSERIRFQTDSVAMALLSFSLTAVSHLGLALAFAARPHPALVALAALPVSGLVYVLAESRRKYIQQAITDPLTGLYTRRHLHAVAEHMLAQAKRHPFPFATLVIDVDRMKEINDTGGHAAGDRALKTVARLLQEETRSADVVARTGGDEFVVLLPYANSASAKQLMKRVQAKVREKGLSLSIGHAAHKGQASWSELLEEADHAMYRQKHAPRLQFGRARWAFGLSSS